MSGSTQGVGLEVDPPFFAYTARNLDFRVAKSWFEVVLHCLRLGSTSLPLHWVRLWALASPESDLVAHGGAGFGPKFRLWAPFCRLWAPFHLKRPYKFAITRKWCQVSHRFILESEFALGGSSP
jgi:hypothetical protein